MNFKKTQKEKNRFFYNSISLPFLHVDLYRPVFIGLVVQITK
jgi:hypothetical protein